MPEAARSTFVRNATNLRATYPVILYKVATQLETLNRDSKSCLNLQFVDMLAGVVGTHYECRKSVHLTALRPNCPVKQLLFGA